MRLNFQKSIANSQTTLPVVGFISFILWFSLPAVQHSFSFEGTDYGLWKFFPSFLQEGYWTLSISAFCAAAAIYMMAELNNAYLLLRVASRMLSSMLAILLTIMVMHHRFQPGSLLMLLSLLSFFPLFATYQSPTPIFSFVIHLIVSVASLFFPKFIWMAPVYWHIQGYFRAFSLRCMIASVLALLLPYWIYGCVAFMNDAYGDFLAHVHSMIEWEWGNYMTLKRCDVLLFLFLVLLFVTGTIDFYLHQYMDKTRTRIFYNALILYGIYAIFFTCIQPQYMGTLIPLLMICTAIVFGHFFTLTFTKFSHIYCIFLLLLAMVVMTAQNFCDSLIF